LRTDLKTQNHSENLLAGRFLPSKPVKIWQIPLPVNRIIAAGPGWYDCYLYEDIVLVYKIQGQRVLLATIGFSKEIADEILI